VFLLFVRYKLNAARAYDFEDKINSAVFPGLQGGPHNQNITALAVALKQTQNNEYKEYQRQVLANARVLVKCLKALKYDIVSGGTDNHLILLDLRSKGISGAKVERLCELVNIGVNKNTIPHDKSAMNPSGVRLGSPAMTSRGLVEKDFEQIARLFNDAVNVAIDVQRSSGPQLADFKAFLQNNTLPPILQLKSEIEEFASKFPTVGF